MRVTTFEYKISWLSQWGLWFVRPSLLIPPKMPMNLCFKWTGSKAVLVSARAELFCHSCSEGDGSWSHEGTFRLFCTLHIISWGCGFVWKNNRNAQWNVHHLCSFFQGGKATGRWGNMIQTCRLRPILLCFKTGEESGAKDLSTNVVVSRSGKNSCSSACLFLLSPRKLSVTGCGSIDLVQSSSSKEFLKFLFEI